MQADRQRGAAHELHDSVSYWQKTSEAQKEQFTDPPSRTDVAVIGGGIVGAATCYWLARAGIEVTLLERSWAAYGATGRNGGFVTFGSAEAHPALIKRLGQEVARSILALTLENKRLLKQVLAEEEIACEYREPGNLVLALSERQLGEMEQTATALRADGCEVQVIKRERVQDLILTPLSEQIVGGIFFPDAGLVHSARLVQGIVSAARRYGARTSVATVQRLLPEGSGLAIHTSLGTVSAGAVVVAANAWTDQIVPDLAGLITPVRGQALAYAPVAPLFVPGVGASVTPTGEYWQQTMDGSIVLGGCRAFAQGGDVGVREQQPTDEVQTALEKVLPQLFPALTGLQVAQRWAGLMAFTSDYLPVADRVPASERAWFAGGFNGHGMPFGIRFGQLLAEAATSGKLPSALAPFSLKRPSLVPMPT